MVDTRVKGGKRRENRGGMGVVKEHRLGNCEKGGGMIVLCGTGGRARSSKKDLRVSKEVTVMLGKMGLSCQISESYFQCAGFWHEVAVPNFWFHTFVLLVYF